MKMMNMARDSMETAYVDQKKLYKELQAKERTAQDQGALSSIRSYVAV